MHLLIFATSASQVFFYEINPREESVSVIGPIQCDSEVGSYLSVSMLIKYSDRVFKFLVANIDGNVETFECTLEMAETVREALL